MAATQYFCVAVVLLYHQQLMFEYRVAKYDPALRNESGAYLHATWTAFSDIGETYAGVKFSTYDYQRVEDAYVATALAFLSENQSTAVTVTDLAYIKDTAPWIMEGSELNEPKIARAISEILREEIWCRLQGSTAFVHFGYDYYMYKGWQSIAQTP